MYGHDIGIKFADRVQYLGFWINKNLDKFNLDEEVTKMKRTFGTLQCQKSK